MKSKSNIKKRFKSDFLFSKMNFLTGTGSVLNIAGNYFEFNSSKNTDYDAICADWSSVGMDINKSMDSILSE